MNEHFWQMSGYATYVWGSFGFSALVYAWCAWAPRLRRRQLLNDVLEGMEES